MRLLLAPALVALLSLAACGGGAGDGYGGDSGTCAMPGDDCSMVGRCCDETMWCATAESGQMACVDRGEPGHPCTSGIECMSGACASGKCL